MSTKLTGYVWDGCAASGMKLSSVAIMARLADFSNDEGVCWPSIETIARQIGAGMSTVRTAIARLEAEGWLTRKARRQGNRNASNVYQLNVAKLQAAAFSQLSDSDPSKSDASKSDPSKFDASKSGKKAGFHPSESGGDPSVKSKHDPSDKKPSRPDASQPDTQTDEQDFLTRHPDAVVFSPKKRQWGTQDDLTCAQWLWKKIIALYEQAAECDGEVVRPKEPNWTAWANEIRLMCVQDGRTHKQICEMYSRVSRDPFWCRNVLSPSKLREKWDELSLRLSPSVTRLPAPTTSAVMQNSAVGQATTPAQSTGWPSVTHPALNNAPAVKNTVDLPTWEELTDIRDTLNTAIDKELSRTTSDALFLALRRVKADLNADINTRLEQSARIIQRTPDEVLPALVLAATWFDNAARDADIIRRNAITHPGFVPVIPLKVPVQ